MNSYEFVENLYEECLLHKGDFDKEKSNSMQLAGQIDTLIATKLELDKSLAVKEDHPQ